MLLIGSPRGRIRTFYGDGRAVFDGTFGRTDNGGSPPKKKEK